MDQALERDSVTPIAGRTPANVGISVGGKPVLGLSRGSLEPPLVSFVVICWNYAQYVAATIASIKAQDYRHFECLVIDNGSTDGSRSVIERAVGDDKRFTIAAQDENIGQLGAALWALDRISGSFVTFVDADDVLFPGFASAHVQVHLAVPRSVAITSSNIFEIDAQGGVITAQYAHFGQGSGDERGFRAPELVPRLSTISPELFEALSEQTVLHTASECGWCWAPGSANMFRRSVLNLCRFDSGGLKRMRAADAHFNNICHAIAGSALISVPLSGYRQHHRNYFSTSESLRGLHGGSREYAARDGHNRRETIECVVEKTSTFNWFLPGRYWSLIDQLLSNSRGRLPDYRDDPQIVEMFTRHIADICAEFGYRRSAREVTRRFGASTARSIFKGGLAPSEYRHVRGYIRRAEFKKLLPRLKRKHPRLL